MFFSFLCLETVECAGVRKPVLLFRQPVCTAEPLCCSRRLGRGMVSGTLWAGPGGTARGCACGSPPSAGLCVSSEIDHLDVSATRGFQLACVDSACVPQVGAECS